MKVITPEDHEHLDFAVGVARRARNIVALTGAGISVESGIDDFRSPGGIWTKYPVQQYGTIEVFREDPEKAWTLFRALGRALVGKQPNRGHVALAELEKMKRLNGIITQNVDDLHHRAGSTEVIEIHGDHRHLQCIYCANVFPLDEAILEKKQLPRCDHCNQVLKPNVVLFGEMVRSLDRATVLLQGCDLLLVIGTSAQVYPAAAFPDQVKSWGGKVFEFNTQQTSLTQERMGMGTTTDFLFQGSSGTMLSLFVEHMQQ